jgi:hypothetical protein
MKTLYTVHTAQALFAAGQEKLQQMDVAAALELFRRAEREGFHPDECAAWRWTCHMLTGHFEEAWRESDAIERRGAPDPNRFWDGTSFRGKSVLIRCLHGLGDTIQFVRYVPLIRAEARHVVIEAQPRLKQLLAASEIADDVITWGDPEPNWDQQIEIVELPRIFRTTLDSIPNTIPYLRVNQTPAEQTEVRPAFTVGVVWTAGDFNPERCIELEELSQLFETPNVTFVSLQAGAEGCESKLRSSGVSISAEACTSISGAAAVLLDVDLVISVDTMVAHLAGALGVNVWSLIPYRCDWRWMLHREDSPWYPTMRLFRQPEPEDWSSVIHQLQRELIALVANRS